jgi:phosphate transport system substrate-binding protein
LKNLTILIAALALLAAGGASAATHFTMQDGSVVIGDIQSLKDGVYTIVTPYGIINVPAGSIRSMDVAGAPSAPARPAVAQTGPLRLAGSTTIGDELMPALLESYAASKGAGDAEWTVEGDPSEQMLNAKGKNRAAFAAHLSRHGSATAFTALLANNADLGMASRPVNKDETQKLQATSFGLATAPGQENVLALDGLVVLVHKSNPIARLSIEQIANIFSGAVTDWREVGGSPGPIHIFARDSKSGTADTFNGIVLKGKKIAPSAELEDGNDILADKVAADVGGIGYAGFAYVRGAKALNIVTDCGLTFPPSEFFVRTEEYPLSRRLFLYAPATPTNAAAHDFTEYALGPAGQDLVGKKGFVDLTPQYSNDVYGPNRVALALSDLSPDSRESFDDFRYLQMFSRIATSSQRVTVTFRFQSGSSDLDSRAVRDIDRVAEALKSPALANREIAVLGFSDAVGAAVQNVALSKMRATQIAALLAAKGVTAKVVAGFGRAAPVACNSTPEGLEKNRRVEVWIH